MKKIYTIVLTVIMLSCFTACKDQLDLQPISAIGDNAFYNTPDEINAAVVAIYDGLQNVVLREFALTEMRSDNTRTKNSEGDWAQFQEFDVRPTNLAISSYWSSNYNVIFRANKVLENLDVVTNDTQRAQYEGEAKFVRALAHFNLMRAYGAVPYIDRVIIQTDSEYMSRDPQSDVLAAIIADLTEAMGKLPSRSGIAEGRATSGAAAALLAKAQLTAGNYPAAETLLSQLLSSPDYELVNDYRDVFYSELNSEIIFAIQFLNDNTNESQDFSFEMTAGGLASGLNYVTNNFIAAVDPLDTERSATLFNPNVSLEVGKFMTTSNDARLCGNDWIVLRLADVYLMHAEAIMAGGTSTNDLDAIASYNAIRNRVGLSTLPLDGSATLTRDMLLKERRIELAFENHRLYDLVRFGVAESVLSAFAVSEGYNFAATDLLLPIPQREIDTSFGILTQNPGY